MPQSATAKQFNRLMREISVNLLVAKIPTQQIPTPEELLAKSEEEIQLAHIQLKSFVSKGGAYYDFMAIYGLKPPQWWDNMAMLGQTDLREHKLLKAESKKLREAWRELNHVRKYEKSQTKSPAEPDTTQRDSA